MAGIFQSWSRLLMKKNYYKILGVSKDANYQQIKTAYYEMAKVRHPDLKGSKTEMVDVNEAYTILSDFEKRKIYDKSLEPENIIKGTSHGKYTSVFSGWSGNIDLSKNAMITASGSAEGYYPTMALTSGWKASGNQLEWIEIEFSEPAYFKKLFADSYPIPYRIKRDNINFVEIHKLIGFEPKFSLRDGLKETINWFTQSKNLSRYKIDIYNV